MGHIGEGNEWIPISLELKSGSIALHIRYKVISFNGQFIAAPPVPTLTDIIPSFLNELIMLRIAAGLFPVDNDKSSLVTFFLSPYS